MSLELLPYRTFQPLVAVDPCSDHPGKGKRAAVNRLRPATVRRARRRLAAGHYDDPKVLDTAIGRLLDEIA